MTTRRAVLRDPLQPRSRRPTDPRAYPQQVLHRVFLCTFLVPPPVGLLFLAIFLSTSAWTALVLAAALFLFTLMALVGSRLMHKGLLLRAARLYLTSALVVVALFLVLIPETLLLPGVIVLFLLVLLAMAVESFEHALGWAAATALVYLIGRAVRGIAGIHLVDLSYWDNFFLFVLPVVELAIFVVLMRAVIEPLMQALASSRRAEVASGELAAIVENSDDAIISKTPDGIILTWNQGAERLYGYSEEELRDRSISTVVPADRRGELAQVLEQLQRGERIEQFETERVRKDGQRIHVSVTISPIRDAKGNIIALSTIARDITERKRIEEELRHLSTHDRLTGLYNRTYFETELERLERGREFPVSVIMADIDGLKRINDSLGHAVGDGILRQAGALLQSCFRAGDIVARIGGDEFGVLLPATEERAADELVTRIRQNLAHHNVGGRAETVSLSIGVATALRWERVGQAIKRADAQMYRDKSGRRRRPADTDVKPAAAGSNSAPGGLSDRTLQSSPRRG